MHWRGQHWALRAWPRPYANIWLGGHRILVVGLGRLDRRGHFHQNQVCVYPMNLRGCCGRG